MTEARQLALQIAAGLAHHGNVEDLLALAKKIEAYLQGE
jgi:hypothetical protein